MKKVKVAFIINLIISALVLIACIFMFTGITFMPAKTLLETKGIEMFKFFTVDSNILIGVISLIMAIYEYRLMKGDIKEIPLFLYKLKILGTSAIFLTFVTTLVFLAPMYGFYAMYNNNNLFFHLIVPILAFVSYVFFEKHKTNYLYAFLGLIPMGIYSVFYTTNVLINIDNGTDLYKHDFYGFLQGNVNNFFVVLPIIFISTYLLTFVIVYLNKKCARME